MILTAPRVSSAEICAQRKQLSREGWRPREVSQKADHWPTLRDGSGDLDNWPSGDGDTGRCDPGLSLHGDCKASQDEGLRLYLLRRGLRVLRREEGPLSRAGGCRVGRGVPRADPPPLPSPTMLWQDECTPRSLPGRLIKPHERRQRTGEGRSRDEAETKPEALCSLTRHEPFGLSRLVSTRVERHRGGGLNGSPRLHLPF